MQIRKHFTFEAAHVLPHHLGKCRHLHGHSYRLEVAVDGPLHLSGPNQGMVVDFFEVSQIVNAHIIEILDHSSLNELIPNPTAELIISWIWERLAPRLPGLSELVLWETPTECAVLRGGDDDRPR